jgi:hypothetical protein
VGNVADIFGWLLGAGILALGMGPFLAVMYAKEVLFVASSVCIFLGGALALGGSRKWAFRLVAGGAAVFAVSLSLILYTAYFVPATYFYNDYYSARLPQWPWVDNGAGVLAVAAGVAFAGGLIMSAAGALRFALGQKPRPKRLLIAGVLGIVLGIDLGLAAGISSLFAVPLDVPFAYAVFAAYNGPFFVIVGVGLLLFRKSRWAAYFLVAGVLLFATAPQAVVASSFRIGWWW